MTDVATLGAEFGGPNIDQLTVGPFAGGPTFKRVKVEFTAKHTGGGPSADDSLAWVELSLDGGQAVRNEDGAFSNPYSVKVSQVVELGPLNSATAQMTYGNRSAGPVWSRELKAKIISMV